MIKSAQERGGMEFVGRRGALKNAPLMLALGALLAPCITSADTIKPNERLIAAHLATASAAERSTLQAVTRDCRKLFLAKGAAAAKMGRECQDVAERWVEKYGHGKGDGAAHMQRIMKTVADDAVLYPMDAAFSLSPTHSPKQGLDRRAESLDIIEAIVNATGKATTGR